jgi:hypothetical protein
MKVRIRMYRAGLGDCFLVTFDPDHAAIHVMIDCGVLLGSRNGASRLVECVDDIVAATDNHVHVLIATHEHWDHLSGFVLADKLKTLRVDQVWLAWTEDPDDALARRLRRDRGERRRNLRAAFDLWATRIAPGPLDGDPSYAATRLAMTREVLAFGDPENHPDFAALGVRGSTSDAMDMLREDRRDQVEYLEPGTHRPLPGLHAVRAYVLGPPRDEKLLRRGRPSRSGETYTESGTGLTLETSIFEGVAAAHGHGPAARDSLVEPFDRAFLIHEHRPSLGEPADDFFSKTYLAGKAWRRIDSDWLGATSDLAIALDNDTNNTSLVLAFELGDQGDVLLFPGDAQVGSWLSWRDLAFDVGTSTDRRIVTTEELLGRTTFYKVGHHASHNATLRADGLERMCSPRLAAMIPVDKQTAQRHGWAMPFAPLYERLLEKCQGRVLVLDEDGPDGRRMKRMTAADAADFRRRVRSEPHYIELMLE